MLQTQAVAPGTRGSPAPGSLCWAAVLGTQGLAVVLGTQGLSEVENLEQHSAVGIQCSGPVAGAAGVAEVESLRFGNQNLEIPHPLVLQLQILGSAGY